MRRRNRGKLIAFKARTIMTIVAVLALVVLNVFDVHAVGLDGQDATAELVQVEGGPSAVEGAAKARESYSCHSRTSCHVGLATASFVPEWTAAGVPIFATPSDMIGWPQTHGLFRPPRRA